MSKALVSKSMEPEMIRDSLVFNDAHTNLSEVEIGDNIAFKLEGIESYTRLEKLERAVWLFPV